MSLNDIRFPASLLSDLYRDSLVSIPEAKTKRTAKTTDASPGAVVRFLGKNLRNILIVVNKDSAIFLPDDELNLLTKMLSACNLTLADVAIVNIAGGAIALSQLESELSPVKMLLLGSTFNKDFSALNPQEYLLQQQHSYTYFFAPDLKEMLGETAGSRSIKTKLWGSLKQMFGL